MQMAEGLQYSGFQKLLRPKFLSNTFHEHGEICTLHHLTTLPLKDEEDDESNDKKEISVLVGRKVRDSPNQ
jgi:hypothetical protein